MSVADNANTPPTIHGDYLHSLFSQLDAQQVEAFYKSYQQWHLEQQSAMLQEQIAFIEQRIVDNRVLLQLTQPSPIALATLTRLQSYGVDDVDLLDSMLERGDTWLDHTLQLLEQCERLDVIHDNYTEWCRHALEGAYDWLDSMPNNEVSQDMPSLQEQEAVDDNTEALLIQKLMSEDETVKVPAVKSILASAEPVGTDLSRPSPTLDTHEESVGTDLSRPSNISITDEERDESVPTRIEIHSTESIQSQEEEKQKSLKHGLVARILARVWQT